MLSASSRFAVMAAKDQTYVPSAPYSPQGAPNREVAVVYYSRSGHSEAAAREIARMFNAPIARIDADYPRDFSGQRKAVSDARAEALPPIRVEPIDLAPARRVFLVSPTWMFRPATPLWAYVEQADLTGKEVVLVTTGNSRFEQAEIDAFAKTGRGSRRPPHPPRLPAPRPHLLAEEPRGAPEGGPSGDRGIQIVAAPKSSA